MSGKRNEAALRQEGHDSREWLDANINMALLAEGWRVS